MEYKLEFNFIKSVFTGRCYSQMILKQELLLLNFFYLIIVGLFLTSKKLL